MAPFVPFSPGVVEAFVRYDLQGIACENTMGFNFRGGAASQSDGTNLANVITTWIGASMCPLVSDILVYHEVQVIDLTSAVGWTASITNIQPGTVHTTVVTNNAAMSVTFQSAVRGRSQRGRNYVSGLVEADLADSRTWSATIMNDIQTAYQDLNTAVGVAGWDAVILSRFAAGAPRLLGQNVLIQNYRPNAGVVTQKRRLT